MTKMNKERIIRRSLIVPYGATIATFTISLLAGGLFSLKLLPEEISRFLMVALPAGIVICAIPILLIFMTGIMDATEKWDSVKDMWNK